MATSIGAFIAGGIAACGAVTMTHPFETVKIRMQLQGELKQKKAHLRVYLGPLHGVKVIVRNEGLQGIYRGIGGAYLYQMILNGCRLSFYEPIRRQVTTLFYSNPETQSLPVNIFAGSISGVMGAAAGSPFFLIKTRLQSFSLFTPVGTQHKYRNTIDGLRQVYFAEGFYGIYRGVNAAMLRTSFGSSVQLPTYFFAKRRLVKHLELQEGPALHLISSGISGSVVCCVMHPTDTVLSRMYNQNGNLYRGVWDCVVKILKTEGFWAMYKGFLPHLTRILPHTILTLSLAEQTNDLMRKFETNVLQISV
ncbi:Mitochondrial oxaloacetate transport protein [Erysiphe necator]|nr:Mitochondrial oxaloacetate transport protein [Erysiphe necator]